MTVSAHFQRNFLQLSDYTLIVTFCRRISNIDYYHCTTPRCVYLVAILTAPRINTAAIDLKARGQL